MEKLCRKMRSDHDVDSNSVLKKRVLELVFELQAHNAEIRDDVLKVSTAHCLLRNNRA